MKALSIRQPWAWLICKGYKDIENREWKLPAWGFFPPQRIYVHTGKTMDVNIPFSGPYGRSATLDSIKEGLSPQQLAEFDKAEIHRGAIIGEVDITGCVDHSDSPWFVGKFGFTLANPVLYEKPVPCKGKLGFFTLPGLGFIIPGDIR